MLKIGDKAPDFIGKDQEGVIEDMIEKVKTKDHSAQILK